MDFNTIIGRSLAVFDYATYKRIEERVTPMITEINKVEEIINYTKNNNTDLDNYMINLLCISVVYDLFCPACLIHKDISRLNIGVRDEVAKAMDYANPEMCNYYLEKAKPFLKFREKSFGQRVEAIKDAFKHLSVRKIDWELLL